MVRRAILGNAPPGRYPRWDYLDRLETDEYILRAFAAGLVLLVAATLVLTAMRHMKLPAGDSGMHARGPSVVSVNPMPEPMPLPPRVQPAPRPPSPQPPQIHGIVELVDDAHADPNLTWALRGSSPGTGPGSVSAAWDGDSDGSIPGVIPATSPPAPTDFIAVEREPELVWMRKPVYPDLAREAGMEGTVLVRALVGADGTTQQVQLLQSVLGLDEAALEAAKTAIFKPALQQGRPVSVWVVIPIEFDLHQRLD